MSRHLCASIALAAAFLAPPQPAQAQPKDNPGTSKISPELDTGLVDGHTYKNNFLNLEFTPPDDLEFREPAMQGKPGEARHTVGVSAWSKAHNKFSFKKYIVDRGVIFVADDLDSHPEDERTAEGYLRHVGREELSEGFKPNEGKTDAKIGDVELSRANFSQGSRLHIVLVTTRYGYAFTLVFVAGDMETVESMIKATKLKLPQ